MTYGGCLIFGTMISYCEPSCEWWVGGIGMVGVALLVHAVIGFMMDDL